VTEQQIESRNASTTDTPKPKTTTDDKAANEEKAALLRAKLLANRALTPARAEAGQATPVPESAKLKEPQPQDFSRNSSTTVTDVDSLVEQGKAAAAAAAKEKKASENVAKKIIVIKTPQVNGLTKPEQGLTLTERAKTNGATNQPKPMDESSELLQYQKINEISSRLSQNTVQKPNEKPRDTQPKRNDAVQNGFQPPVEKKKITATATPAKLQVRTDQNSIDVKPKTDRPETSRPTGPRRDSTLSAVPFREDAQSRRISNAQATREQEIDVRIKPDPRSGYWDDLDDWLEVTRYHDEAYRCRTLQVHRKRKEIDIQRAVLERHVAEMAELERAAQSVEPTNGAPPISMPPPPLPDKYRNGNVKIPSNVIASEVDTTASRAVVAERRTSQTSETPDRAKRASSPSWEMSRDERPPEKLVRIDRPAEDTEYHIRGTTERNPRPLSRAESVRLPPASPIRNYQRSARSISPRGALPLESRISLPGGRDRDRPFENDRMRLRGGRPGYPDWDRASVDPSRHWVGYDHFEPNTDDGGKDWQRYNVYRPSSPPDYRGGLMDGRGSQQPPRRGSLNLRNGGKPRRHN